MTRLKAPQAQNENAIVAPLVASRKNYLFVKRAIDIVISILLVVLFLSWMLPLLAFWIWLDSPGPVFFVQKRMGRNGKPFRCIKLRTMVVNEEADDRPAEEADERITRAGRVLRITNLDELPQLFNVLAGNMSLVGPRPHMLSDCARFSFIVSSYQFRTLVRPGITGLAQIKGYHGPARDYENIVTRYYWDAVYVRKAGIRLDMLIIARTISRILRNIFTVFAGSGHSSNKIAQHPAQRP